MRIVDTVPYFLKNYQPSKSFLQGYYNKYPDIFKEYFAYHCRNTEERFNRSIEKYPQHFSMIKRVHQNIVHVLQEIAGEYFRKYQISFPVDVNLIVGGYGSNAFTYRQVIPNITFALEKLSPNPDHLKAIVAHEFVHAAQNIVTDNAGIDWSNLNWESPLIWLYQEGAATHFSRQTAPYLNPSIYFSFDDNGEEWLTYCKTNQSKIKAAFKDDYLTKTPHAIFQEWFSINGGKTFGHSRLAY